jgi:hypothetical protein
MVLALPGPYLFLDMLTALINNLKYMNQAVSSRLLHIEVQVFCSRRVRLLFVPVRVSVRQMVLQILYYHPPKKKYQFLFHWTDFYEI